MVSALFSYFLLSIYLVKLTLSQLSSLDSNQIISLVNSQRDEKSGLFGGDLDSTYKSVFTLKTLGEEIREIPKICKEIGYVSSRTPQLNLFLLEELLTCKNDIVKVTELNSNITSLITFYENLLMGIKSDFKIDFIGALIRLQSFQDNEKLFKESNEGTSSRTNLLSTAYGLKALSLLYNRLPEREKVIVVDDIKFIINQINNNYYHSLSSDISFYSDGYTNSIVLNSEIIEALSEINKFHKIEDLDIRFSKLLNYLLNFKYNVMNVEQSFYYAKSLKGLSNVPIFTVPSNVIGGIEEKEIFINTVNVFGKSISQNLTVNYKILTPDSQTVFEDTYELKNSDKFSINITNKFQKPGKYFLSINAGEVKVITVDNLSEDEEENKNTNSTETKKKETTTIWVTKVSSTIKLQVNAKIKINYLKCSITNSGSKDAEKEIQIEHPKRSFKEFKGTQKSIIQIKLKINFLGVEKFNIEQIFLRLRHIELGKVFSSYATATRQTDDYFLLNFNMNDANLIEAYDGVYELSIIVSDPSLDNPIFWNFGKLDMKFQKPKDPTDVTPSYKNNQKQKMEPNYTEEKIDPKYTQSFIFCGIIGFLTLLYARYLAGFNLNLNNIPKRSNLWAFGSSVVFVLLLFLIAYVYVLFWIKINIIQALTILLFLGILTVFFGYRTLIYTKIDL